LSKSVDFYRKQLLNSEKINGMIKIRELFRSDKKGWIFLLVGIIGLVVVFAITRKTISPWYIIPGIFLLISKFYFHKWK